MEINIVENEYCKLEVHYNADFEQIQNKRAEVLSAFKNAPVKGFRPGKASIEVIKVFYKKQIEDSLKRAMAEEAFHNTIFEKSIKPLGHPDFTSIILSGNKFSCDFRLNKKPDFELGGYKDLEIPKPVVQSVDFLTEKILEDLRSQYGEMMPYTDNDFVENTDRVIVRYTAHIDGEKEESLSADEGEPLTVGANPLKEFDDNLLGMKSGEERTFDIMAPVSAISTFAGKTITFNVSLDSGMKINKMPLSDELAKKLGKDSFEDLRNYVAGVASKKIREDERQALVQQVNARLVAAHDFKVPGWLCISEAQYLAANSKLTWDTLADSDKEQFIKLATNNVKIALIFDRIRENEPEAQLSDQEVIDMIKKDLATNPAAQELGVDGALVQMDKTGYLQVLVSRLRDEATLDFILKTVKVIE